MYELRILAVGETVLERSGVCLRLGEPSLTANGSNVNLVKREKIPFFGSHWK